MSKPVEIVCEDGSYWTRKQKHVNFLLDAELAYRVGRAIVFAGTRLMCLRKCKSGKFGPLTMQRRERVGRRRVR